MEDVCGSVYDNYTLHPRKPLHNCEPETNVCGVVGQLNKRVFVHNVYLDVVLSINLLHDKVRR